MVGYEYVEFVLHFVPSPIQKLFDEQDLTNVVSRWHFPLPFLKMIFLIVQFMSIII